MLGGTFALLPAYEADLFGQKYVGNIHGKILLALSVSALGGPKLLFALKNQSELNAIKQLLQKVDPTKFFETFGCSIDLADQLIKAKTLTISQLMRLLPPGTVDPTPYLYDTAFYSISALMAVAAISNYAVRKVDPKYFEKVPVVETAQ